ncbi:hypothetical protein C8Q74DRAFT_771531 [Fomes fomentarius]|nr:hypothetical protein C8Q74DRAFT_771531 [Fomes fomentarius]
MSTSVSPGLLESDIWVGLIQNYCALAIMALILYDYMLTLPVEVAVFWNRKFTGVSALFFFNRYFSLLLFSANTHTIWLAWPTARGTIMPSLLFTLSCYRFDLVMQIFTVLMYIPYAVFSGLRVYALTERCITSSVITFVLACAPFAINLVIFALHWTAQNIDNLPSRYQARIHFLVPYLDIYWGCEAHYSTPRIFYRL